MEDALFIVSELPLPAISPAKLLSLLHWSGAIALILLIGGHLMGVVYHTFVRRDGLLRRMM